MSSSALIDTASVASKLRSRIIRPETREILIARLAGSDQESDLTLPPNAGGLGRIRHFRRETSPGWPANPLPIDPAARALGLPRQEIVEAQVFQNAGCAWRCWYCYVPYELLGGNERSAEWRTAEQLVGELSRLGNRPRILDLTGGSPDLTPEWVIWTMEALEAADMSETTYLWSDDNLSTDYLFSILDDTQLDRIVAYRNYGRVCCFKGFDADAFAFNTSASPQGYDFQFELFSRYLELGIDLYAYATITGPSPQAVEREIPRFIDRLQGISEKLPLRVIPLEITAFGPMLSRKSGRDRAIALETQERAISVWNSTLSSRFSPEELALPITEVRLPCSH